MSDRCPLYAGCAGFVQRSIDARQILSNGCRFYALRVLTQRPSARTTTTAVATASAAKPSWASTRRRLPRSSRRESRAVSPLLYFPISAMLPAECFGQATSGVYDARLVLPSLGVPHWRREYCARFRGHVLLVQPGSGGVRIISDDVPRHKAAERFLNGSHHALTLGAGNSSRQSGLYSSFSGLTTRLTRNAVLVFTGFTKER